jgi:hypothetical protein
MLRIIRVEDFGYQLKSFMVRQGSPERRRRTLKKQLFSTFKINDLQEYKKNKKSLQTATVSW